MKKFLKGILVGSAVVGGVYAFVKHVVPSVRVMFVHDDDDCCCGCGCCCDECGEDCFDEYGCEDCCECCGCCGDLKGCGDGSEGKEDEDAPSDDDIVE